VRRIAFLILTLLAAACATPAAAATPDGQTVIAVIDSGINAQHAAFDPDQVVAWWDFSTGREPAPGETWDHASEPRDGAGHGTAVAAMAAGRQAHPDQSPSAAPGTKLAIARVTDDAGDPMVDLTPAIRWAVETAGADVINISIGSTIPWPGAGADTIANWPGYDAIEDARAAGVLVVIGNGNGLLNLGVVPSDGASGVYGSSTNVLAVGAASTTGQRNSWQPEVTAEYYVTLPAHDSNDAVRETAGTSFSSPYVAGFAARLLTEACAAGQSWSVARLERLLKYSANDTLEPPNIEGYGWLTSEEVDAAIAHARQGTLPGRPDPDVNALYVEQVAGAERDLNNGRFPGSEPEVDGTRRTC
jgi:Subtilase family